MPESLIVAALRTPVGTRGGSLAGVRPDDLAAVPLKAVIERTGFDAAQLDDVILGCANQAGEDNRNVARMASLLAGFPVDVPGQTVNRLCGSGLQAVASASHTVKAGDGRAFMAGGVECMTRAPYVMLKKAKPWDRRPPEISDTTVGWRFINPKMPGEWTISMGQTAEVVAKRYGISRADQDAFALESQRRAKEAQENCIFHDEIVPVPLSQKDGAEVLFEKDEHPRPGVTIEKLAKLKPAFVKDGTVTAGSSSGINDGAAALLVTGDNVELPDGVEPLARVLTTAVAGVDPSCMGLGPIPADKKSLGACQALDARHRPHRTQRSVCGSGSSLHSRAGVRYGQGEHLWWCHSVGPSAGLHGRKDLDDPLARVAADGRTVRTRHDVHRRRAGYRDDRGARMSAGTKGSVSVCIEDGIGTIMLNRPDKLNAFAGGNAARSYPGGSGDGRPR